MIKIKDEKRYIGSTFLFLSSFLYFFLAYEAFKKTSKTLSEYENLTSVIVDKGQDYRYGSRGKRSLCFFIYLDNLRNQKLGVYRFSKNYSDLDNSLLIGDEVTVFFIDRPDKGENINIDLIQINKKNKLVLDKLEYDNKEKRFLVLMIIVGALSIVLSYLYFKRLIIMK
jgi:hypothetical protein